MITIVKGNSKLIVTRGQFEDEFEELGYHEAFEKKEATKTVASLNKEKGEDKKEEQEDKENKELDEKFGFSSKKSKTK